MRRFFKKLIAGMPLQLSILLTGVFFWLFPRAKNGSFSQYGEDQHLLKYFDEAGVRDGLYIDVGAYHPKYLSNTHRLHQRKWQGALVDISLEKLFFFKLLRPRCLRFHGAVVAEDCLEPEVTAYFFKKPLSEFDTLSYEEAQKVQRDWGFAFVTRTIPTLKINNVLAQVVQHFERVPDFLNIDIEGLDEAIVQQIDFEKYPVRVIAFENNEQPWGSEAVQALFKKHGYERLFSAGGTHAYARG